MLVVAAALSALAAVRGELPTVLAVLAWGVASTAIPVGLQSAVLRVAPDNQEAASAVYVVAFQIGIGLGSFLGDRFVAADRLDALPVFSALVAVTAGIVVLGARRTFPR